MKKFYILGMMVLCAALTNAQPTSTSDIESSYKTRKQREDNSLLKELPVRNIGPTVQGEVVLLILK